MIPYRQTDPLSLWSVIKKSVGSDLIRISLPVNFNEPISTLQRLTENFDYADILHRAAQCADPCEQMTYVAAFTVSPYSTTANRTLKPFNPLLGETYECDRTADLGWRAVAEQVVHHPPTSAQYVEGRGWTAYQELATTVRYRGPSLQVVPAGVAHAEFHSTGHHYTWGTVTTFVNNIIIGKLWIDNSGEMDIVEHKTKTTCHLKYHAYKYFSSKPSRRVSGVVRDRLGEERFKLSGSWADRVKCSRVLPNNNNNNNNNNKKKNNKAICSKPSLELSKPYILWEKRDALPNSEKMYHFTKLTIELNEPEEGVAPTDSRLRPDQRLMEEGQWAEADQVKRRLEEKQRERRNNRDQADSDPYKPVWFKKEMDKYSGKEIHMYQGQYWQAKESQDWSRCPDILI